MRYICAIAYFIICIPMKEKKRKSFGRNNLNNLPKTNKSVHLNLNRRQKQMTPTLFALFLSFLWQCLITV